MVAQICYLRVNCEVKLKQILVKNKFLAQIKFPFAV